MDGLKPGVKYRVRYRCSGVKYPWWYDLYLVESYMMWRDKRRLRKLNAELKNQTKE